MNKPIQVGDLVQVVRPGVCSDQGMGNVFRVLKIDRTAYDCICCGREHGPTKFAWQTMKGAGFGYSLARLKRIPPLDELEGKRTEENLKVPA